MEGKTLMFVCMTESGKVESMYYLAGGEVRVYKGRTLIKRILVSGGTARLYVGGQLYAELTGPAFVDDVAIPSDLLYVEIVGGGTVCLYA